MTPHRSTPIETGSIAVPGGSVHFERYNPGAGVPLLVVHGGPGAGSGYLKRLARLAEDREVVLYDQLGCGRSATLSTDPSLWAMERYLEEIDHVRQALDFEEIHVFGHSSGGWIVLDYLATKPAGVRSVTLANTSASAEDFREGALGLVAALPTRARGIIAHYADDVWSTDEAYLDALAEFYARHIVRDRAQGRTLLLAQRQTPAYTTMMGPHELALVGTLRAWDRRPDLSSIHIPALVVGGGRDHMSPACAGVLVSGLPNGEPALLEQCGHDPLNESTDEFLALVQPFLVRNDRA